MDNQYFWFPPLRDFVAGTATIYGIGWTVIEANSYFNPGWEYLKQLGQIGHYMLVLHSALLGLFFSVIMSYRRYIYSQKEKESLIAKLENSEKKIARITRQVKEEPAKVELTNALVEIVKLAYTRKDYAEVIRLGRALSRPLWLGGEYKARILIGELVEEAAALLGDYQEQATALVDDLGWTYVVLQSFDLAVKNINHGIEIAEANELVYITAKGKRHLGNIYRMRGNYQLATDCLMQAKLNADKDSDANRRDEMISGIHYALADLHMLQGKYEDAIAASMQSKVIYERLNDSGRLVKTLSQIADIYLGMNELTKAKDIYRQGLHMSKELARRDEITKNLIGLGKIYLQEKNYNQARSTLVEAEQLLIAMNKDKEVHNVQIMLSSLPNDRKQTNT